MIAVWLSPLYIAVNAFFLYLILKWLKALHSVLGRKPVRWLVGILYCFTALTVLIAFWMPASEARRYLKLLANYQFGFLLYQSMTISAALAVYLTVRRIRNRKGKTLSAKAFQITGAVCAVVTIAAFIYGTVNARMIRLTQYQVKIQKDGGSLEGLRIALAADLHLGYNVGCPQMEEMVEKINEQKPDLVLIAGDIFDNEFQALDDPERLAQILRGLQSTYGSYAVYGNHDIEEPILAGFSFGGKENKESSPEMDQLLIDAGICRLTDESVLIADSFYLYGRPDYERPNKGVEQRREPSDLKDGLDPDKAFFVLEHEPRQQHALAQAGVDLVLCGHTHDGQLFPGNILCSLLWENSYGYRMIDTLHSITTSGVGVFGPYMRVGTRSEICIIDVEFVSGEPQKSASEGSF